MFNVQDKQKEDKDKRLFFVNGLEITTTVMTITPKIAERLLENNTSNRPLSKVNVKFLVSEIKNGNWQFDGQPIKLDWDDALLDGQHRLHAIIETGVSLEFLIVTGLKPESFKVMDTGRKRTGSDILAISGIKNASTASSTTKFIYGMEVGLYSENRNSNRTLSNTNLLDYYDKLSKISNIDNSIHLGKTLSSQFQAVVNPTLIGGFHHIFSVINAVQGDEFIKKLCTGIGLVENSPILALRNKLIKAKGNERYKLTNKDVISLFIISWNKFRNHESAKVIQIPKGFDFTIE